MINSIATDKPIDQLIDRLAESGVPVTAAKRERLRDLFMKVPYKFYPTFPCPSYTGTDPFQPIVGQPMTFNFTTSVVPFNYTLVIMDVTDDPVITVVFQQTLNFTAPPFQFNIPASTFAAGRQYSFVLYPSIKAGAVVIPFGCVSTVAKASDADEITKAVFAALDLFPAFPC